jgi:hypothetical protein
MLRTSGTRPDSESTLLVVRLLWGLRNHFSYMWLGLVAPEYGIIHPCLAAHRAAPKCQSLLSTERVNALVKIDHLAAEQRCIMWT